MTAGLRDYLAAWSIPEPLVFKETPLAIERVIGEVKQKLLNVEPAELSKQELKEVWLALKGLDAHPKGFGQITKRLLRRAPWAIFQKFDENEEPLVENKSFLKKYFAHLLDVLDARAIATLHFAMLRYYPVSRPYFKLLYENYIKVLNKGNSPKIIAIRQHVDRYKYFENDGPKLFAANAIKSVEPLTQTLSEAGLSGELENFGFIEHSYANALVRIKSSLQNDSILEGALKRFFNWSLNTDPGSYELRYPKLKKSLAEALLLPFIDKVGKNEITDLIQEFLIEHYGDPRTDKSDWYNVDDAARAVLMRWLVTDTLEDFFKLLDYSAKNDKEADRHWKYRKAFWSAYLRQGYISDAWVALGDGVRAIARKTMDMNADSYAGLAGYGVKKNHAVLIMRIGDQIITEWNHSGKYRIWNVNSENAPNMYKPNYSRRNLVEGPDEEGAHYSSENGHWQALVANYINSQTGCLVPSREYMAL